MHFAQNEKELREMSLANAETIVNRARLLESKGIYVEVVSIGDTEAAKNMTPPTRE